MENKTLFRPRTYTWQELGLLYSPDHTPYAASKRLRRWVTLHPSLREELTHIGWKKGSHVLTPPPGKLHRPTPRRALKEKVRF